MGTVKKGTKVVLKKTGQIGTVVDWDSNPHIAKIQIITPDGPKIVQVLKTVIEIVQIVDGLWPLLKALWKSIFPGKGKKVLLDFNNLPESTLRT